MRVDMSAPARSTASSAPSSTTSCQIQEFRKAQTQFKDDLPTVLDNLRATSPKPRPTTSGYQQAAAAFLDLCRNSIGPNVSPADVREMLLQHILTKDIFLRVFGETQFHSENNVAARLDALEQTFFTGDVRRQAIDRLRAYYGAIGRAADEIADHAEQAAVFQGSTRTSTRPTTPPPPTARRRLHPQRDRGLHHPRRTSSKALRPPPGRPQRGDPRPATGTGTFVTNLIDYLAQTGEPDALQRLEHKYLTRSTPTSRHPPLLHRQPQHRYTYRERTGRYLEFPNLCFVDSWTTWTGRKHGATGGARHPPERFNLGAVSTENWMRVQLQNEKTISVIIGNPPYNANQQNENDNNKNREGD